MIRHPRVQFGSLLVSNPNRENYTSLRYFTELHCDFDSVIFELQLRMNHRNTKGITIKLASDQTLKLQKLKRSNLILQVVKKFKVQTVLHKSATSMSYTITRVINNGQFCAYPVCCFCRLSVNVHNQYHYLESVWLMMNSGLWVARLNQSWSAFDIS